MEAKIQELEDALQKRQKEFDEYKNDSKELESMMEDVLKQKEEEVKKLTIDSQSKDQELKRLKQQLQQLDQKKQDDDQSDDESRDTSLLEITVRDLKQELADLNKELETVKEQLRVKIEEAELEIECIKDEHQTELQQLQKSMQDNNQVQQLQQEIQQLKASIHSNNDEEEFMNAAIKIQQDLDDQEKLLQEKEIILTKYQVQIKELESKLEEQNEFMNEAMKKQQELDEQAIQIQEKDKIILQYQMKINDQQQKEDHLIKEKDLLNQQIELQLQQLEEYSNFKNQSTIDCNQQLLTIKELQIQVQQLSTNNPSQPVDNSESNALIAQQNIDLQAKCETLNQQLVQAKEEIEMLEAIINDQKDNEEQLNLLKEQMEIMNQKIQEKDSQLQMKQKEFDSLNEQSTQQSQEFQDKIAKLEQGSLTEGFVAKIEAANEEIAMLESIINDFKETENELSELQKENSLLKQQITKYQEQIQEQQQQPSEQSTELQQQQQQQQEHKDLQICEKCTQLENQLNTANKEITALEQIAADCSNADEIIGKLRSEQEELKIQVFQLQQNQNQDQSQDSFRSPSKSIEQRKQQEQLEDQISLLNEKLNECETENTMLTTKSQELLGQKEQLQHKLEEAEKKLLQLNEVLEENAELKQLITSSQETINRLQSTNEYQTLYLQLEEEHNNFRQKVEQELEEKENQLQLAASYLDDYETMKDSNKALEENNTLLNQQVSRLGENNKALQDRLDSLAQLENDQVSKSKEYQLLSGLVQQLKEEIESLKQINYEQSERLKDYEIKLETLQEIECESPKKIAKLQTENSEWKNELQKIKDGYDREVHLMKSEKQQLQVELKEFKEMIDSILDVNSEFEPQNKIVQEYMIKLLEQLEQQNSMIEKKELKQNELEEQLEIFRSQLEKNSQLIKIQPPEVQNIEEPQKQIETTLKVISQDFEQQTEQQIIENPNTGFIKLNKVIQLIDIDTQTDSYEDIKVDQNKSMDVLIQQQSEESIQIQGGNQQINQQQMEDTSQTQQIQIQTQIEQDQKNSLEQQQQQQQQQQLLLQQFVDAECNTSSDNQIVDDQITKKKIEDLENLLKSLSQENYSLKEKYKKLEEKQKPQTPRKYSDRPRISSTDMDFKEQLGKYQKIVKEYEFQISQLQEKNNQKEVKKLKEDLDVAKFENEQLLNEIEQMKEELRDAKKKGLKLQNDLTSIYNLGPQALEQLQSPQIEQPQQVPIEQPPKINMQLYLYLKAQRNFQSPFLEFNRKNVKVFSAVKNRIERSLFDQMSFDEIFFDTQKIHQFLDFTNKKLGEKAYIILGQSKSHKKMLLIMLIELIQNVIINIVETQRVVLSYQERIGKQWIEIDQFNLDTLIENQNSQDLEFCLQNIKVHLLTKQYGQRSQHFEKIRKLTIIHQVIYNQQVSQENKYLILTSPIIPRGELRDCIMKMSNEPFSESMQYNCFLNLIPTLQNYKLSVDTLSFVKIVKQFKSYEPISSRFNEENVQDAAKFIRQANNKVIIKSQEIDLLRKQGEMYKKQWNELLSKQDQQQQFINLVQNQLGLLMVDIKTKINVKLTMKKHSNKKSQNIQFLDKLVSQIDSIMRRMQPQSSYLDSPDKFRSKASQIMNPFSSS